MADGRDPLPTPPALEDLLVEALERLEGEGPAGLERLLAEHPDQAGRVRAHLERVQRLGLIGSGPGDEPREHPERLGDFRILAPLGHGGMGIVYRALQESLGREVALKLVRPDQLYFPGARERFRREVELVARMQHPGIVPVHAVGSEEGVPYFAMELLHGATLADVIEQLAGRGPRALEGRDLDRALARHLGENEAEEPAALFRGSWTMVVLRLLREVAEALEHAHRRGVLHRDVKPSNVMVTREGRVLLVDFGLAGAQGGERMTRTGSQLGSLAYMAPELLAGEARELDARCDVYSLGATAWELLALRLPYQSSDPIRLRELAGAAARPGLSALNPAVPWDVETVIATALEPDPSRRYASAALLARDVDNVLAHRPIEAREPGSWLRLRRWTQRHPARATAAAAALILLVGGPSLYAWQEARARRELQGQRDALARTNVQLEAARQEAEHESVRAQRNFEKLQQAVDTMLTKVGDESLRDVPRMERVRRDLLEEALRFYRGFLAELPDDPRLRAEAGRVQVRSAEVLALLGRYEQAERELTQGLALLGAAEAAGADVALDRARARTRLAGIQRLRGDLAGAQASATEAAGAWRGQVGRADTAVAAQGLGLASLERGLILADLGDLRGAAAELEASLGELEAAGVRDAQLDVLEARTLDWIATWSVQRELQGEASPGAPERLQRAVELHERARALWETLLQGAGEGTGVRAEAVRNGISLGIACQLAGDPLRARAALEGAVRLAVQLVADFPDSPRRSIELATARSNLAALYTLAGDKQASAREYAAALEVWRGLAAAHPQDDEIALGLAQAVLGSALEAWEAGRWDDVRARLAEAASSCDRALTVRPGNPTYRRVRRRIWNGLAGLELELGRHAEAAHAARRLLEPALAPGEPTLVGGLLARCAPLAEQDAGLPDARRVEVADGYRDEALALLEAARAAGRTLEDLRADPLLTDLWGQPGFEDLLELVWDPGR